MAVYARHEFSRVYTAIFLGSGILTPALWQNSQWKTAQPAGTVPLTESLFAKLICPRPDLRSIFIEAILADGIFSAYADGQ
ncbi:hypothetical protein, partial [Lacticaseibacillus songhuajiangensis]|uniref:hypothetical protein n=1 Tax=Lacticaseibacillus songhuajiangensis TaxID=1296539 RepID=UPI001CDD6F6B